MTKKELIRFLKENLTVEVRHPEHNVGYYSTYKEPDEHNITVKIKLCGECLFVKTRLVLNDKRR